MSKALIRCRLLTRGVATFFVLLSVSACGKSEPVYSGISLMGQNYLPYTLDRFTITDAYGNKAGGASGKGRLSCCYFLRGTEFTVKWDYYDGDQWHKGDEQMFHAVAKVSMPPSEVPDSIGARILQVHFYPDRHVELQFPGRMLSPARVPLADVVGWLFATHLAKLDKRYPERDDQQARRIDRVVAGAWLKYRLTDLEDLQQYAYFNLLINRRFDAHPEVQRILQSAKDIPGQFAKAIGALPRSVMQDLKRDRFKAVAVPVIPEGFLPPPRIEE